MSRWLDRYQNHPYLESWANLKQSVENIELDDDSVQPSVEELARLRKVVAFLDELLESIDPELVPSQTWDNFQKQSNAAA